MNEYITSALVKLGWRYRVIHRTIFYLTDYRAVLDLSPGLFAVLRIYYGDSTYEFRLPGYYCYAYNNVEAVAAQLQYIMRDLLLRENKL